MQKRLGHYTAANGSQWDKGEALFHEFLPLYFEAKDAGWIVGNEYHSQGCDEGVLSFSVVRITEAGQLRLARG